MLAFQPLAGDARRDGRIAAVKLVIGEVVEQGGQFDHFGIDVHLRL